MKWLLLALAILLAGCADAGESPEGEHRISGSFTTERTQADLDAFGSKVSELAGEWVLMESWPEQFQATFSSLTKCEAMHNWVHQQAFISQSNDSHCVLISK